MRLTIAKGFLIAIAGVVAISACRKKDAPLPDNLVQFESDQQGMGILEQFKTVKVKLSRATNTDIQVLVAVTSTPGVDYDVDYQTDPVTTGGNMHLTIPSGSNEASFLISKKPGALFYGDDQVLFKITSSSSPVIIGSGKEFTLNFSEIVNPGSTIVGDGGGATYGNKVFFDVSANSQTAVSRTKWDLGFFSGDDWKVILNSSTAMMAKQINKTDLNAVTATDTVGFGADVIFNQTAPTTTSLAYIDYPTGDLTKTAIATVSATAAENKVYIINRGAGVGSPAPARGWKKVRILRNASGGYTLQHADIAATTFTSVDIPKNAAYFFNYVSFENGAVGVEPQAKKWDLAWTYFSNVTNFGGGEVPYTFQDIVLQNRNVQAVRVMTAVKAFADFAEADLTGLTWSASQTTIGADWRSGGGPGTAPAVRTDRYYIIKDADNNYYKIRFTAMTQGGERGFPAFESVLVKKGS